MYAVLCINTLKLPLRIVTNLYLVVKRDVAYLNVSQFTSKYDVYM